MVTNFVWHTKVVLIIQLKGSYDKLLNSALISVVKLSGNYQLSKWSYGRYRVYHWFSHTKYLNCYYLAPHRGRARYCNAHVCLSVCLFVCLCVCLFVRVFAKFQCVISQPFLNRSLWNLAYILRMGTPWLTNIFRILGQRSRS